MATFSRPIMVAICCLLFAAMLCPVVNAGSIYKCTINGRTEYQDRPCGPDATVATTHDGDSRRQSGVSRRSLKGLSMDELSEEMLALDDAFGDWGRQRLELAKRLREMQAQGKDVFAEWDRWDKEHDADPGAVDKRREEITREIHKRCQGNVVYLPATRRYGCGK